MGKDKLKQITEETYHFLNNKGVGFICYMWDKEGEYGGGCQSALADIGNAMVVISKITKHFDIDPIRLQQALMEVKREMEEN